MMLLLLLMLMMMLRLYHVMFNMVAHEYHDMHGHGLIGNEALAMLEESVGEATDCTDRELNHKAAADFGRFRTLVRKSGRRLSGARRKSNEMLKTATEDCYLALFE